MIVFGGTGAPFGLTTSNALRSCDLSSHIWSDLDVSDNSDIPPPLYGQAVLLHRGNLYTVGGTSGIQYFMDVHKFDFKSGTWKCLFIYRGLDADPAPRYRHELAVFDEQLLVFGGGTAFEAHQFVQIPAFDLETNLWHFINTLPDPTIPIEEGILDQYPSARRCHSALKKNNHVYVFGGYDGETIFGDFWRLDLMTWQWKKLPQDMPDPVYFHASISTDSGKIITFGGVDDIDNNSRTNKVYSTWTSIPTLRNMCWEAINYYVPNISNRSTKVLLEEGIPKDLISLLRGADVNNEMKNIKKNNLQ